MILMRALFLSLLPTGLLACGAPVCLVNPDSLALTRVITFDDIPSGAGPGLRVDDVMNLDGAQFGEIFAGQGLAAAGAHDQVIGAALGPLILLPGAPGQNLSVVNFYGNTVLNGYGPAGFPRREGQGKARLPCSSTMTRTPCPLPCAAANPVLHLPSSCAATARSSGLFR
ncbi:hypothetical protein ACFQFQ_07065 [Sulfitobacter porphyrae]|uniref:Uncharacterized protein n=1 Tax=Sulfitobacter porphyrae TaxID=1246864 RepID=A0ABW2B0U7_9RHOB